MSSLFRRRREGVKQRRVPVLIPEKSAQEVGFSFEHLSEEAADECIDAMLKAMPQVRWNREGLRRGLLSPNSITLVAKSEGAVVGLINGTVFRMPGSPPTIGMMAILDQKSGERGLGGYLIDEFINAVQKKAPKASFVDVSLPTSDTGSIALYSLKGFVVEGFVKNGFRSSIADQGTQDLVVLRRWFAETRSSSVV